MLQANGSHLVTPLVFSSNDRAKELAPGDIVYGGPWRHEMRGDMGSNPRAILDAISYAHPIVLLDASQHLIWCNSLALQMAGITEDATFLDVLVVVTLLGFAGTITVARYVERRGARA